MSENKTPYPFEMPVNRLLSRSELILLESHGIETHWIKCKTCANEGATTDDREHCSLKCYCIDQGIDYNKMKWIEKSVYLAEAAQEGDLVEFKGVKMRVIATDCTERRIKNGYSFKYNYVLKHERKIYRGYDLDTPLRKYVPEVEEKLGPNDNTYYE